VQGDAFDARLRAPFATLGITTDGAFVSGIRFLVPGTPALAPKRNTLAYLVCVQLQAYLDDPRQCFDLPLQLSGSRHQLSVWEAMQAIAVGRTRTYGDIAQELGSSPRAVGGACGANPLPIVIPCHRVVASAGIGGFMGATGEGFERGIKRWLLTHEARARR